MREHGALPELEKKECQLNATGNRSNLCRISILVFVGLGLSWGNGFCRTGSRWTRGPLFA
jgi:hypothetical protein